MKKTPLITSLILLLSIISCNKNSISDLTAEELNQEVLINEAKRTFQTQMSEAQARTGVSDLNKLIPSEWQAQWDKATAFKHNNKDVVEVPLLYNGRELTYTMDCDGLGKKTTLTQPNGVTRAVFFKQPDGSMNSYIMRFILETDYFKQKKTDNIYKQLSLNKVFNDFSGFLTFSSWKGDLLDIYYYESGQVKASNRSQSSSVKGGRLTGGCETQVVWRWVCFGVSGTCCTPEEAAFDPGSVCCRDQVKYCSYQPFYEDVCTFSDPSEPNYSGDTNTNSDTNYGNDSDIITLSGDPVADTRKLAAKVPATYKTVFKCVEFANSLKSKMQANGIHGDLIKLQSVPSNQNIYSDLCNCTIATNGIHMGIQVNGIVFDNMNVNGIDYNTWRNTLHIPSGTIVVSSTTPF